jgi:hypothetical protein
MNIPLSQIPNAPDLASMSRPQVNDVNVPNVDFSGERAAVARGYDSVIRSNEAAGQSASKIGGAVAGLGDAAYKAANQYNEAQQRLNDTASLAEFQTNLDVQKQEFIDGLDKNHPETWQAKWSEHLTKNVNPQWQALPVSVQQKGYAQFLRDTYGASAVIGHDAHQQAIANDMTKAVTNINYLTQGNEFEKAKETLDELNKSRALSPEQYQSIATKIETGRQMHGLNSYIGQKPDEAAAWIQEAITSDNQLDGFGNITKEQLPALLEKANRAGQVQQVSIYADLLADVDAKQFQSPVDMDSDFRFNALKNPKDREALKNAIADKWLYTPQGEASAKEVMSAVKAYPSTDTPAIEAAEIQRRLGNEVPSNLRKEIAEALGAKKLQMASNGGRLKPEAELIQYGVQRLHMARDGGVFGNYSSAEDVKSDPSGKLAKANIAIMQQVEDVELALRNSGAKTRREVDKVVEEATISGVAKKASESIGDPIGVQHGAIWNFFHPKPKPSALIERPQASNGTGEGAAGKVTSYGYEGDQYGGPDAKATKEGAFGNSLTDKSLAVSPDIQARFKEAGIKPMEPVELTLEDGTKVVRNYDDHTASDQEARKLGLKPLRGRFDFRSVGGKQEKDGMRIVSFRKYTEDGQG